MRVYPDLGQSAVTDLLARVEADVLVAYDTRLLEAARSLGLSADSPT